MRKKISFIVFCLCSLLLATQAYAQEPEPETEEARPAAPSTTTEDTFIAPDAGATDKSFFTAPPRDTDIRPLAGKPKSEKFPDKEDDDALTFNFLYYIIQKFKISDIRNN